MNTNPFIYIRGLKHADFTVFCVADGQKTYFDPQFNTSLPYSSGQQVKRSVMAKIIENLRVETSPITFVFEINNNKSLGESEVLSACNPLYVDQLIGGWMMAKKKGTNKKKKAKKDEDKEDDTEYEKILKRRSPLSVSAMTPLHPLLASSPIENISFDRTDQPEVHKVVVRDANNKILSEEEVVDFLKGSYRSLLRKWIPKNKRATGLFTYDVAIDLRRLFCVSTNQLEPEIDAQTVDNLKNAGWKLSKNVFGECLVMPKEQRDKIIPAIADALIDWHITSNQARTFSLMETLAIAISDNANTLSGAIRAKLIDDGGEKPKAKPIVDENVTGAEVFVTLPCASYVVTESECGDALDKAKEELVKRLSKFDYENQL